MMHTKRSILLITSSFFSIGGIQKYNQALARGLFELGYQIDLIDFRDLPKHKTVPYFRNLIIVGQELSLWAKIKFVFLVFRKMIFSEYDLVICGHTSFAPMVSFFSICTRKKFIVNVYGTDAWNKLNCLHAYLMCRAKRFLSVSEFTREKVLCNLNIPSMGVSLLCCCVEPERTQHVSALTKLQEKFRGKFIILSVGRIEKNDVGKGYRNVVGILPELLDIEPALVYVIAGGGSGLEQLEKDVRLRKLDKHVFFAGAVTEEDLAAYYELCDLFVLPSKIVRKGDRYIEGEGFGIVYIEAAYHGKPVIAINEGGVHEAVLDNQTGFLIRSGNDEELLEKIKLLIQNRDLRCTMGVAGKRWVDEHFSYDSFKKQVAQIMSELIP